jgi:hypothetical protein
MSVQELTLHPIPQQNDEISNVNEGNAFCTVLHVNISVIPIIYNARAVFGT